MKHCRWFATLSKTDRSAKGKQIEVITVNDASFDECSESSPDVFVIAEHFRPDAP